MFKLDISKTYFWPVKFDLAADNGRRTQYEFLAEYTRLPQSRIDELIAQMRDDDTAITDDDIVNEVMVGWDKVQDQHGKPLAYSDDYRAMVLDVTGVRGAVVRSWFESVAGVPQKN